MIRRSTTLFLLILTTVILAACGLLSEPQEASGPIEAIPLELETPDAVQEAIPTALPAVEEPATAAPDVQEPAQDDGATAYPPPAPDVAAAQPATAYPDPAQTAPDDGSAAPGALRIYQIGQDASEVTFELDEDLRGQRTTVIGTTNQVAGEIALNLADLSTAQLGVIQINARTLLTDNNFRNRAIQNEILETGAHEFITFRPTAITGLPASAAVGQEINFTVEGELTIRDITQPVTFHVVAVAQSETELTGSATTTIERSAYNLIIPQVPQVANVEEAVDLTITFTARAT